MAETDLILVVDENDKPIGNEMMKVVREKGLIHRIVRIMVEDGQGKILLQKRTAKLLWPNCWDNSASGHVDADEEYLVAAKREAFEEIGLKLSKLEELGTYLTEVQQGGYNLRRFNRVYRVVKPEVDLNVRNDEVAEVRWFTIEEAKQLVRDHPDQVTDGLKDVLQKYYS